jgi:hypothetical protein
VASVVGGWGFGETAPPQPSAGLAETVDGHTITADAATQAEGEKKTKMRGYTFTWCLI